MKCLAQRSGLSEPHPTGLELCNVIKATHSKNWSAEKLKPSLVRQNSVSSFNKTELTATGSQ